MPTHALHPKIIASILMAARAVRLRLVPFPGSAGNFAGQSAAAVLALSDRIKMIRIDARSDATQMIEHHPFGQVTNQECVGHDMRPQVILALIMHPVERAVPMPDVDRSAPDPARPKVRAIIGHRTALIDA